MIHEASTKAVWFLIDDTKDDLLAISPPLQVPMSGTDATRESSTYIPWCFPHSFCFENSSIRYDYGKKSLAFQTSVNPATSREGWQLARAVL